MKRVIVDYKKLTPKVLSLLTKKYPDGYGDRDIITFDDHHNQTIEAVEVKTKDTIYLVKVSTKLHYTMLNFNAKLDLETRRNKSIPKDLENQLLLSKDDD